MNEEEIRSQINDIIEGEIQNSINEYLESQGETEGEKESKSKGFDKGEGKLKVKVSQEEVNKLIKGDPAYTYSAEGKKALKTISTARDDVMKYALRNWNQNKGQGDIKFFDAKGNPITWQKRNKT